ncbi:Uma2 family endonuclease [Phormidesmis priestleyi]
MSLTTKDLEKLQTDYPDYRMELVDGEIIVMSPSGYESDEVATRFTIKLGSWVDDRRLGRVTGSRAGFTLSNSDTRAPDVSFVFAERLRRSPRSFAELAPDLMVEVKSSTDIVTKLRKKIDDFLSLGTRVGILINPEKRWVEIRRSGEEPVTLRDSDLLTIPDLLPGWEVEITDLWSPEFD